MHLSSVDSSYSIQNQWDLVNIRDDMNETFKGQPYKCKECSIPDLSQMILEKGGKVQTKVSDFVSGQIERVTIKTGSGELFTLEPLTIQDRAKIGLEAFKNDIINKKFLGALAGIGAAIAILNKTLG